MQTHADAIREAGGCILVVTFSRPDVLASYLKQHPWPFPVVTDPERKAYTELNLGRASLATIFRPTALRHYAGLIAKGWLPRLPVGGEDPYQLGGDFVLNSERRLIFAHRSTDPSDRPRLAVLLDAVREAAAQAPSLS